MSRNIQGGTLLPLEDAKDMLHILLKRVDVTLSDEAMKSLFSDKWATFSLLAHSIHAGLAPTPKPAAQTDWGCNQAANIHAAQNAAVGAL